MIKCLSDRVQHLYQRMQKGIVKATTVACLTAASLLPSSTYAITHPDRHNQQQSYTFWVHGINQTCGAWSDLPASCIDLPSEGHGGWTINRDEIETALSQVPQGRPVIIGGYSLGGASVLKFIEENPAFLREHPGSTVILLDPAVKSNTGELITNPLLRPVVGTFIGRYSLTQAEKELTGRDSNGFLAELEKGLPALGQHMTDNGWKVNIANLNSLIVDGNTIHKVAETLRGRGVTVSEVTPADIMNTNSLPVEGNAGIFPRGNDINRAQSVEYLRDSTKHAGWYERFRIPLMNTLSGWMKEVPFQGIESTLSNKTDDGGIDLRSMTLQYLTEGEMRGSRYFGAVFKAVISPNGTIDVKESYRLSIESFLNILQMPDHLFWVNLNPNEPNRIIDDLLRNTDIGQILLTADVQLKKKFAYLTDPRTSAIGRQFWNSLTGNQVAARVWIVPKEIEVYANNHEIYIRRATMDVLLESQYLAATGHGGRTTKADEEMVKRLILPEMVKSVNEDPEFEGVREVFHARILAKWYNEKFPIGGLFSMRQRILKLFSEPVGDSIIHSRHGWNPKHIFDAYMKSFRDGEYHFTESTRSGSWIMQRTYFMGGVDFTNIHNKYKILGSEIPSAISSQLSQALLDPLGSQDSNNAYLGRIIIFPNNSVE